MKLDKTLAAAMARESPELLDLARAMLRWDAATGQFWWKVRASMRVRAGDPAGFVDPKGYLQIKIRGVTVLAHRLLWALEHGFWPPMFIDHRSTRKDERGIGNLRLATKSQNMANRAGWGVKNGRHKGVTRKRHRNGSVAFHATIQVNGHRRHLGSFETPDAAADAYRAAARACHGPFAFNAAQEKALLEVAR